MIALTDWRRPSSGHGDRSLTAEWDVALAAARQSPRGNAYTPSFRPRCPMRRSISYRAFSSTRGDWRFRLERGLERRSSSRRSGGLRSDAQRTSHGAELLGFRAPTHAGRPSRRRCRPVRGRGPIVARAGGSRACRSGRRDRTTLPGFCGRLTPCCHRQRVEEEGTFTNLRVRVAAIHAGARSPGMARPSWWARRSGWRRSDDGAAISWPATSSNGARGCPPRVCGNVLRCDRPPWAAGDVDRGCAMSWSLALALLQRQIHSCPPCRRRVRDRDRHQDDRRITVLMGRGGAPDVAERKIRRDSGSARAESRGLAWASPPAADGLRNIRRRRVSGRGEQAAIRDRTRARLHSGDADVRSLPFGPPWPRGRDSSRWSSRRCRSAFSPSSHRLARRLRDRAAGWAPTTSTRSLAVCAPVRNGFVRDRDGTVDGRGAAVAVTSALNDIIWQQATTVWNLRPDRGVHHLPHRRLRRNQPTPFDLPESGIGAHRRLYTEYIAMKLRSFHRRVLEHGHPPRARAGTLFLEGGTFRSRPGINLHLDHREDPPHRGSSSRGRSCSPLLLHVDPVDASTLPLRQLSRSDGASCSQWRSSTSC